MDTQDLLNITTISISTILSVGAIILSFWFYRMSNKQNKETALLETDIKNAINKLEQLYNRTYTDTFGALKTQLDAMQKHIFTSTVGETNSSEPDKLRFYVLGYITEKNDLNIDELCQKVSGFKAAEIKETIYQFHQEGIVNFDGNRIKYIRKEITNSVAGQEK